MKKIRLIVGGGLGNQLFQFAAYIYLVKTYPDISVELDFFQYKYDAYHNGIEIQKLFFCKYINEIEKIESYRRKKFRKKYFPFLLHTIWHKLAGYKTFYETDINTPEKIHIVIQNNNKILMAGFYQNPLFVNCIHKTLQGLIKHYETLGVQNDKLISFLKEKTSVSIHVRRGDYLSIAEYNAFDSSKYYMDAVSYIKSICDNPIFIVFSNDLDWVKSNLALGGDTIYVDWNKGEESYKDMILMSTCNHNIIANSSFSWWAAWLNAHTDKTVVAPKQWFKGKASKVVVPKDWVLIDC